MIWYTSRGERAINKREQIRASVSHYLSEQFGGDSFQDASSGLVQHIHKIMWWYWPKAIQQIQTEAPLPTWEE